MRVLGYYPQQELERDKNLPVQAKGAAAPDQGRRLAEAAPGQPPAPTLAELLPSPLVMPKGPLTVMPDLKGYTIRQVLDLLTRSGLKCRLEGQRHGCEPGALPGDQPLPRRRLPGEIQSQHLMRPRGWGWPLPRAGCFYKINRRRWDSKAASTCQSLSDASGGGRLRACPLRI